MQFTWESLDNPGNWTAESFPSTHKKFLCCSSCCGKGNILSCKHGAEPRLQLSTEFGLEGKQKNLRVAFPADHIASTVTLSCDFVTDRTGGSSWVALARIATYRTQNTRRGSTKEPPMRKSPFNQQTNNDHKVMPTPMCSQVGTSSLRKAFLFCFAAKTFILLPYLPAGLLIDSP